MNDNAPESESWAGEFFAKSAKNCSSDLWLPVPARARHDEPITAEAWERRDRARREAEAVIGKAFARQIDP